MRGSKKTPPGPVTELYVTQGGAVDLPAAILNVCEPRLFALCSR